MSRPRGAAAALLPALLLPLLLARPAAGSDGAAPPPPPARPAGEAVAASAKVTWRDLPLAGARVAWRLRPPPEGEPSAEAVTDGNGVAAVRLPPGRYFVTARWSAPSRTTRPGGDAPPAPGERFAYFGGNPVPVPPGDAGEPVLPLAEVPPPPPPPPGPPFPGSGVHGVVTVDGAPLRDAWVSAYRSGEGAFREMAHAVSPPTGEDGSFALDLPPGRWYLVARKRASGGPAGPLRPGDAFGYLPGNPLRVEPGRWEGAAIPASLRRKGSGGAPPPPAAATVEGRVTGPDGRPRRGVHAGLYDRPDRFGRPRHMSEPTGADGRYRIVVPAGGTFFLGARSGYGGSPAPGDLQGRRDGPDNGAVTVREGDRLEGLDIVVEEVW